MTKQTPWEYFVASISQFSDTAWIKLKQKDYNLTDEEMEDIQRFVDRRGDIYNFLPTIIANRKIILNVNKIIKHRNWKWFLRIVKDDSVLYDRLISGIYIITEKEKKAFESKFDPESGLAEILNSLEVVEA